MKKFLCIVLAALAITVVVAPEQKADAQVVYSRQCCDGNGVIRCILVNWTPVGNSCYCYGQGYGYTC